MVVRVDDMFVLCGNSYNVFCDNVYFEYGIFVGCLGWEWFFFFVDVGVEVKLLLDLVGFIMLCY